MYQKLFVVTALLLATASGAMANLSKEDVRSILTRARGISYAKADVIIDQMEQAYGTVDGSQLRISALLSGSRFNYGFYKDRKMWNFDVTYTPRGTREAITTSNLVRAEVFNGGIKAKIGYDWMWIALPEGMTVEDLNGHTTPRGISGSATWLGKNLLISAFPTLAIPTMALGAFIPDVAAGVIPDSYGNIGVYTLSVGLNGNFVTSPKIKFSVNEVLLRR